MILYKQLPTPKDLYEELDFVTDSPQRAGAGFVTDSPQRAGADFVTDSPQRAGADFVTDSPQRAGAVRSSLWQHIHTHKWSIISLSLSYTSINCNIHSVKNICWMSIPNVRSILTINHASPFRGRADRVPVIKSSAWCWWQVHTGTKGQIFGSWIIGSSCLHELVSPCPLPKMGHGAMLISSASWSQLSGN